MTPYPSAARLRAERMAQKRSLRYPVASYPSRRAFPSTVRGQPVLCLTCVSRQASTAPSKPSSRLRNNVGHRRVPAIEEELPGRQHHHASVATSRAAGTGRTGGLSSQDDQEANQDERQHVNEDDQPRLSDPWVGRFDMVRKVEVARRHRQRARDGRNRRDSPGCVPGRGGSGPATAYPRGLRRRARSAPGPRPARNRLGGAQSNGSCRRHRCAGRRVAVSVHAGPPLRWRTPR